MNQQQIQGTALLLVGLALLIISVGVAWALSRSSRTRRVDATWLVMTLSVLLFFAGVAACYFGVSLIVEN